MTPKKDVQIKYSLRFPEQQGNVIVGRGLPEEKIKLLQPIVELKESFAPDGSVEVSPAKSATSTTSVRVNSSYTELIELAKRDLEERNAKLFENSVNKAKREFEAEILPERRVTASILRRNLEDFVLRRMESYVPKRSHRPFSKLIRSFTSKYKVDEISTEHLDHLARSQARRNANSLAHLDADDRETVELKEGLMAFLRKYGEPGEVERYTQYWEFAVGRYGATRK